jgi:hypothetical protein
MPPKRKKNRKTQFIFNSILLLKRKAGECQPGFFVLAKDDFIPASACLKNRFYSLAETNNQTRNKNQDSKKRIRFQEKNRTLHEMQGNQQQTFY